MHPDCTAVHTARGPTPRNNPLIPSVRYIILRPLITDDVSNIAAACGLSVVEGDEVEICRVRCLIEVDCEIDWLVCDVVWNGVIGDGEV